MLYQCPMKCEGDKTYTQPGKCPVCGMNLEPLTANPKKEQNHTHAHKSPGVVTCPHCGGEHHSAQAQADRYICPMRCEGDKTYPEPGDCPVCGMHLVKVTDFGSDQSGSGAEEMKAYRTMRNKFILSSVFALPVFLLSMVGIFPKKINLLAQFLLSLPVVFYAGAFVFKKGYQSVISRNLNMFTLISIGTGVAWLYSVIGLFLPQLFPASFLDAQGFVTVYFEASAIILTLVLLGQMLELLTHAKTNSAIRELLNLVPPTALVLRDGKEVEVHLMEVVVNDKIIIKPGNKIPVDGKIIEGNGVLDESMITGEPLPIDKTLEDQVTGGTINTNGSFIMLAQRVGKDTLLAQIIEMVNQASQSKAPIQESADIAAKYFVPAVVGIALLTLLVWGGVFGKWDHGLINAIAVLIIACPCALGLATPVSIMVGTGKGAAFGILIKNAEAIEQMRKVETVLVDKTGTLTQGKPALQEFKSFSKYSDTEILQLAASVDNHSEHPLAKAIVAAAKAKNIELLKVQGFASLTGLGTTAKLDGQTISIGNDKLVSHFKGRLDNNQTYANALRQKGQTVIYVMAGQEVAGILSVADPIKESTLAAVKKLHAQKVKIIMLTGDNAVTAKAVAAELGLDEFRAECLPEDKFNKVKELQQKGEFVAMAGDGINDAPALAQADVGIAMGTGTDVAMQSADVTLVKGNLLGIARAKTLSVLIIRNIRQNLFFAFAYNSIGIPVAALGWLNPMIAGLAMALSSVSVLSNALRLRSASLD